jgi:hypothetical protein
LDIFEMTSDGHEPIKKCMNQELLSFWWWQVDIKDIKGSLWWWNKHENMFPIVALLAWQILGITSFQIECEQIFLLTSIFTNLWWCRILIDNLKKPIFVNWNWHNDLSVGCHGPEDLAKLEEKFKGSFEHEELLDLPHR